MAPIIASAIIAALLAFLVPTLISRLREGPTFRAALPGRTALTAVSALAAATLALGVTGYATWGNAVYGVLPAYVFLAVLGTVMAFVDIALHRLPDAMTLPSYPITASLLVFAAIVTSEPRRISYVFLGMAAMLAIYALIWVINPAGMGFGDVKLAGILGMALGFLGYDAVVIGTISGFLLSAVISIAVLAIRRSSNLRTEVPHGPAMLLGAVVGVLLA